jgi:hypothetical protein
MRTLVVILVVVFILVLAWYAFGNTGRTPTRRRVIERPAARRVVRRRRTIVEHDPDVVEERRNIE